MLCLLGLFPLGLQVSITYESKRRVRHGGPQTQMLPHMPRFSLFLPFFPQDRRKGSSRALMKAGSHHGSAETAQPPTSQKGSQHNFKLKGTSSPSMLLFFTHYQRITFQCLKEVSFLFIVIYFLISQIIQVLRIYTFFSSWGSISLSLSIFFYTKWLYLLLNIHTNSKCFLCI